MELGAARMGEHREIISTGRTGARFPASGRHARYTLPADIEDRLEFPHNGTSAVGRAGARFPSAVAAERITPTPEPEPEPPVRDTRVPEPVVPPQAQAHNHQAPRHQGPRTLVRPYVLTRGRTQSRRHLAIEALVSTKPDAPWHVTRLTGEFRSVRSLCDRPRSVAEVAATLSVPLGVVRVLLDDMAEQGLVTIHETRTSHDGRPAMALMERVLHGLRRL